MHIRYVTAGVLCGLLTMVHCMHSDEITVDDTEVAVSNALCRVRIADGSIADSVHLIGVKVGDVAFGTVRAGTTTQYYVTRLYGPVSVTVDSLAIYVELCAGLCYTARYAISAQGPYSTTIERYERNRVVIDTSVIPVGRMFGQTRVAIRNGLARVQVGGDSIHAAVLYGVRVGGVSFGTVDTNQTSDTLRVPDSTRISVTFDSVVVTAVSCIGSSCRETLWSFPNVTPFTVTLARYVTNTLAFTATSAATDSLFAHLGTPRP